MAGDTAAYFGLDIGTRALRMVQLEPGTEKPSLVAYGSQEMPADLVSVGSEGDKEQLAELIGQLRKNSDITAGEVVVSLPSQHFKAQVLQVPSDAESLSSHIYAAMSREFGMEPNSIKADWHIVQNDQGDGNKLVFVAAAPKEIVDKHIEVVNNTGLQLRALEVNALALARSVIYDAIRPVLVLDFGGRETEVATIWQRIPYASHSVPSGETVFTEFIAQNLNVDQDQARQFLKQYGASETKLEGQVLRAMQQPLDSIITQIQASLNEFDTIDTGVFVGKIIMTGTATAIPEVPAYIANHTDLPVEIANPWVNISYPATRHDQLMSQSTQFAVASGLALREFI